MRIFCTYCGAANAEEAAACFACGTPLETPMPPAPATPTVNLGPVLPPASPPYTSMPPGTPNGGPVPLQPAMLGHEWQSLPLPPPTPPYQPPNAGQYPYPTANGPARGRLPQGGTPGATPVPWPAAQGPGYGPQGQPGYGAHGQPQQPNYSPQPYPPQPGQNYPQQPGYGPQGYPQQPGQNYPQQPGYPPLGYPQQPAYGGQPYASNAPGQPVYSPPYAQQPGYAPSYPPAPYAQMPGYGGVPVPYGQPMLASAGQRFGAYLLDSVVVGVPMFILLMMVGATSSVSLAMLWMLLAIFGPALYFITSWATTGRTVGYRAMGLQLVRTDGSLPGTGSAIARYLGVVLCCALCFFMLIPGLLGVMWMLWDNKKQTWYDKMADTLVIKP